MYTRTIPHTHAHIRPSIDTLSPHQLDPAVDAGCIAVQSLCPLKEGLLPELALDLDIQTEKNRQFCNG